MSEFYENLKTKEHLKTKEQRMKNLFNRETGRAVMIPMDHGIMGVPEGLEDPIRSLKKFVELKADTLLINFGILKLANNFLKSLENPPGVIMGVDFNEMWWGWKTPIKSDCIIGHCLTAKIEQAVKYDVDAVKVYFALGLEPKLQLDYIKHICELVSECDRYGMPLMIEPTTDGEYIPKDKKSDPEIIADGCRLALELGADILKAPYPGKGDKEAFAGICSNSHVPVVMLGGPKKGGIRTILQTARDGIDAGARGTIFGRNVWQRPVDEMERVVKALQDIVHRGVSTDEALTKHDLA
jgi:DhnA-type fructose-1,6-bisphosphate aldolase and related enzymes